uniref:Uncharacterized protein n=1 Tax=Anguilla anguilla TaxID=7936 RepID=A0A0E9UVF5_ANGAN
MKEAANLSTDGILRKDLDASDNTPNGTHQVNTEVDTSKEAVKTTKCLHLSPVKNCRKSQKKSPALRKMS